MIIALQVLVFFRESFFAAIDRFLRPYYKHFPIPFNKNTSVLDDDESEDHVFAEFDDDKGVVFFPPVYTQRYAAVTDCLMDERWSGNLEKVVDFGYHDTSFIKYLKEIPGIKAIYGVDIESIPLRCSPDLLVCDEYGPKRETPLHLTLFQGNAADPDYRLIGCDAVIAIEMIEHMLPQDLERLVHTIFGFIKPWIAVITTPNGDFNPLFTNLEKNGLRRLDHFFEWSREQFHDWCSNIVVRYPQYTVSCRGIGPGPPGTQHFGCCSQLALFVAKNYNKQQDLNLNSLALVPKVPPKNCEIDLFDSMDNITETNMIGSPDDIESYTELVFSDRQSSVTIALSRIFSIDSLEYHDKTAQCNIDKEVGKNFLMFDEEPTFNVIAPRRKVDSKVYVIGDVNSRLNCTTFQVKKFSKRTQNLLSKNKIDSLVHTKEVVDEIRHLTKMLNFNNSLKPVEGTNIWQNINWGENAPFWNQYYKVIQEYIYPFENKSQECRILDLISDEINRLVDTQYDDEFTMDVDKLEIPIEHLMRVVQHVTDDVNMVKDLLEWNGYEIVGDVVIHSRLVVDSASAGSQEEWRDNDTFFDWDTDVHSTSFSEGSTVVPDYNGRCLYRALDQKVRKLKKMVSADQDISIELDRVVCRLLKLALRTARRRQRPLPQRWMQCKLLDLLTLTEKAIEKKRQHYVEESSLKAICYEKRYSTPEAIVLSKIKEDDTADEILNKYQHLVHSSEKISDTHNHCNDVLEDDLLSNEFLNGSLTSELNFDSIIRSPSLIYIEPVVTIPKNTSKMFYNDNETSMSRTRAWVDEDINTEIFCNTHGIISLDTDHFLSKMVCGEHYKKHKKSTDVKTGDPEYRYRKRSHNKVIDTNKHKDLENKKYKDNTCILKVKKAVKKKSSYNILIKTSSKNLFSTNTCLTKSRKKLKLRSSHALFLRPISNTLTTTCHPDLDMKQYSEVEVCRENVISKNHDYLDLKTSIIDTDIAATKESILIDIITEDNEETIALRRTIGTDADDEPILFEKDTIETDIAATKESILIDIITEDNEETIALRRTIGIDAADEPILFEKDTIDTDIAATKESILINIITEDNEETIALRRTIGTDADDEPIPFEKDTILGSLTNIMKIHSFCDKRDFETEDALSQTIFILDINEPSTSKGVRHIGMDVKCGPDNTCTDCPMPSATTSFNEINNIFNTGIKIDESKTNTTEIPNDNDFGTLTEDNYHSFKTITPKMKSFGIIIKDSGTSITNKVEVQTIIQDTGTTHTVSPVTKMFNSTTCTTLLKAVSSRLKIDDSGSEFCGSVTSSQKSPFAGTNLSKNISNSHFKTSVSKATNEGGMISNSLPKLCCGGVYVHSYKDKQVSEDVVYQGEWQKYRPKSAIKRRRYNTILPKRNSEAVNNKHKLNSKQSNQNDKVNQMKPEKHTPIRKYNSNGTDRDLNNDRMKTRPAINNAADTKKFNKNVYKAQYKLPTNSVKTKITKVSYLTKKPSVTFNVVKNDNDTPQRCKKKSYIPLYLKRKLLNNEIIDTSLESDAEKIVTASDEKQTNDLLFDLDMNTESIKKNLLNFDFKPRENVSYVIFRNEIELKKNSSTDCDSPLDTLVNITRRTDDINKRSSSSQSLHSSADSSPNSIATVRARTTLKMISDRRHSTSSNKSNSGNSPQECGPGKGKKYTKRCKTAKKTQEKVFDNKENVPESSKRSKDSERNNKPVFVKNKNIFRAHISDDSTPQIVNNKVSKHKSQLPNKSNVKIPSIPSSNQKESIVSAVSPKVSKEKYDESRTSMSINIISDKNIDSDVILMPTSCVKDITSNYETMEENVIINIVDNNLLTEWMNSTNTYVNESYSNTVLNSIRHLIEERLDFIVDQSENDQEFDSKTVVLGNEILDSIPGSRVTSYRDVTSLNSNLSEAIEKRYLENSQIIDFENSFFDSVVYNDFDPVWGSDSIISITESKPTVTDSELLSFKSLASTSNFSEYFLAESSLSNVPEPNDSTVCDFPNKISVRDIFERKTPLSLQGPVGALAMQAFSGFSMNAEPITGDQPDPINLIDSETGSSAIEFARQAISEEVFISGRSSDSYASCLIDDDTVVPNWLFQIISQQQSVIDENEDSHDLVPMPFPVAGPTLDGNANVVEPGMGATAGAGDGCGIHSDNSEDSSGRGTSLSSTDTSSGPQSEAVLIDPTVFTTQYDVMREPNASSSVPVPCLTITPETPDTSRATATGIDNTRNLAVFNSSGDPQRIALALQGTSDIDADVSSIDTDAPDSDN